MTEAQHPGMPVSHARVLLAALAASVVAAIGAAWIFGPAVAQIDWIGTLFLNALKMTIVPLVFAAIVSGVASLGDVRHLGRLGAWSACARRASTTARCASCLLSAAP